MDQDDRIRTAFERNAKALTLRPSIGRGTAVTRVRVVDGLTCEIEEGRWKLTADVGETSGGHDRGPNPGILGRAALGSCLAIGYMMWAAKLGVPIRNLAVEIQADYDSSADYGVGSGRPGYQQVRCIVTVESPAPEADVLAVLNAGDAHSPYRAIFADAQDVRREVRLTAPRT